MLWMTTDYHDFFGVGEVARNRIEHRNEIRSNDEYLGASIVHDERHFGGRQSEIHIDTHRIEQRTSVEHFEVLDGVLIQERNAILVAHTRGLECLGHLA